MLDAMVAPVFSRVGRRMRAWAGGRRTCRPRSSRGRGRRRPVAHCSSGGRPSRSALGRRRPSRFRPARGGYGRAVRRRGDRGKRHDLRGFGYGTAGACARCRACPCRRSGGCRVRNGPRVPHRRIRCARCSRWVDERTPFRNVGSSAVARRCDVCCDCAPQGRWPMNLTAECGRCTGLCCVAPAFSASADFGFDKPAGRPCRHLLPAFGCGIHAQLAVGWHAWLRGLRLFRGRPTDFAGDLCRRRLANEPAPRRPNLRSIRGDATAS